MVIIIGENIAMAGLIILLPAPHLTAIITITTITADVEIDVTGTAAQFTVTGKMEIPENARTLRYGAD